MKISVFLMVSFETTLKISLESEKIWHSNENFLLSHDNHETIRKAADQSNYVDKKCRPTKSVARQTENLSKMCTL